MYGDRWRQWQPLTDVERSDILRAEIGYALAEDKIGLERFRDRYAPKMAGTPDARAFEIVSAPLGSGGEDFKDIAHAAAAEDTLDDFLRDMKARYPEVQSDLSEPTAEDAGRRRRKDRHRRLLSPPEDATGRAARAAGPAAAPPSAPPPPAAPPRSAVGRPRTHGNAIGLLAGQFALVHTPAICRAQGKHECGRGSRRAGR